MPIVYVGAIFFGLSIADQIATTVEAGELGIPIPTQDENYGVIVGLFGGFFGSIVSLYLFRVFILGKYHMHDLVPIALVLGLLGATVFGVFYGLEGEQLTVQLHVSIHATWQATAILFAKRLCVASRI